MPDMPPITSKRQKFSFVGIDYFGLLCVDERDEVKKVWVCLHTCLVVRAVHLEIMSAEHFLMEFRRCIAHWGKPKQIISDNASQFKLAKIA